jgi:uroporphyrinogen-III synthase
MMEGRPGVLLTRPIEIAMELADRVSALGFDPVINPLLELAATGATIPDHPYSGIIFTSQAGVRAFPIDDIARRTPVFTVGAHTAQIAKEAGFRTVTCGGETVSALAEYLRKQSWPEGSILLYASGVLVAADLAALLEHEPPRIVRVPLYVSRHLPLTNDTIDALCNRRIAWIMVFSARTAEALARELRRIPPGKVPPGGWISSVSIACMSSRIAEPIAGMGWKSVVPARYPTVEAMLDCLTGESGGDG